MRRPKHPGKHFSPRQLYFRSFTLSFFMSVLAITTVLSATLVSGGFWRLNRVLIDDAESVQAAETAEGIPIVEDGLLNARTEDGLTVLIMGIKEKDSISNTYLLLRFDPKKGRIPVTSLPPQTMVTKPQGDQTPIPLTEAYRFGGYALTVQALENTLGFPIDRYVVVDTTSFEKIAETVGSVQFFLSQELDYKDRERVIRLSKGTQLVNGQKAIDIVTYPNYPGGDSIRAEMTASLAVQIINSKIALAASAGAEELFKAIINRVETNITFLDFEERKALAAAMESLSPAFPVYPEGGFSADGESYLLTESGLRMLRAYFGR